MDARKAADEILHMVVSASALETFVFHVPTRRGGWSLTVTGKLRRRRTLVETGGVGDVTGLLPHNGWTVRVTAKTPTGPLRAVRVGVDIPHGWMEFEFRHLVKEAIVEAKKKGKAAFRRQRRSFAREVERAAAAGRPGRS